MRHILTVKNAYQWNISHPRGFATHDVGVSVDDVATCQEVQHAADIFMSVVYPAPLPAFSSVDRTLRWIRSWWRAVVSPQLPVAAGAYWVELGDDGNLHIGGRLPAAETFIETGRA